MTRIRCRLQCYFVVALVILAGLLPPQQIFASTADASPESLIAQLGNDLRISYHNGTGQVRFIGMEPSRSIRQTMPMLGAVSPEQAARSFLSTYGPLFGLSNQTQELSVKRQTSGSAERNFVRFQQLYNNIPIFGGEMIVQLNAQNEVLSAHGEILPAIALDVTPQIESEAAAHTAVTAAAKWHGVDAALLVAGEPALWIYDPVLVGPSDGATRLVWRLEVTANTLLPIHELVLIDAQRGSVALHFNQIHTIQERRTYTAGSTNALPGTLVCDESNPTCSGGSADAIAAHLNIADAYAFYSEHHGRDSVDNAGMTLISTVEYCPDAGNCPYANAFWDGQRQQMVYGTGYPGGDDVVAHELTHGVTDLESQLFYYYQSGAINESFSDIWGEFVDLTNGSGNDNPDVRWQMGEDIPIGAIRNMQDPTLFGDPDRMTSPNYHLDATDNGGVHLNSGINNKAAYLLTDGGTFNGKTVTGLGIDKVAAIYYEVQTNFAVSGSDYADLYDMLYQACLNKVGSDGITLPDCQEVRDATDAVEMNLQPIIGFNEDVPLCSAGESPNNLFFDDLEAGTDQWTGGALVDTNRWGYGSPYGLFAHSGEHFLYADDSPATTSDSFAAMMNSVEVPASAYLHFAHAYDFEDGGFDGGLLEYSINAGATWLDAGSLFDFNGYDGTISSIDTNPLGGRMGFLNESHGYISSRLDLSTLAGQDVRFRWRMGLDSSVYDWGWWLDDVRIYTCVPDATLNATKSGTGSGTVTSSPVGISCGADCEEIYAGGTSVTLTAAAAADSRFGGWTGACSGAAACLVTMDANKSVDARFDRCFMLSLTRTGEGSTPVATPLNSPGCAVGQYIAGESVLLTATPSETWQVDGWNGTTNNSSTAMTNTLTMPAANHEASVLYARQQFTLHVTKSGTGSGTVTSSAVGISCGADCEETYTGGIQVTLHVTASAGSRFGGWTGACSGAAACLITMGADKSVDARFDRCYPLTLSRSGSGGTPVATPSSSSGCAVGSYVAGAVVNLTAAPATDWLVSGWNGTANNSSTATTNTLTMPTANHAASVVYVQQTEEPKVFIPLVQN
ncbi:MAG: M4 family metallopeptidase [Caldilineaceae bacterium]|nr:M4 family metallopeptidase [Caldilineaceae bacterium]